MQKRQSIQVPLREFRVHNTCDAEDDTSEVRSEATAMTPRFGFSCSVYSLWEGLGCLTRKI